MGSQAYGTQMDTSDSDIYGFCIPPKHIIFPHLGGYIQNFSRNIPKFDQWQEHGVADVNNKDKTYDFQVFNIVKYFALCMENNPNMLDSLFVPQTCILQMSEAAGIIRENRKLFLHKGSWHKLKGYAYSQLHKIDNKEPVGKRVETVKEYGYDVKFAYHVVRLLSQAEMILTEHDLDLQRNREQLKSIRRGEWTLEYLKEWASEKEKQLEKVYTESTLRHEPDEETIKQLLLECLRLHYGSLDGAIVEDNRAVSALRNIQQELDRVRDVM